MSVPSQQKSRASVPASWLGFAAAFIRPRETGSDEGGLGPSRLKDVGASLGAALLFSCALLSLSPAFADEAFVPNQGADDLAIVELPAMTVAARLPLGGKPAGVAVSPDGAFVYVTSPEGGFVSVIDAKTRRRVKRLEAPGLPFGVAVSKDGARLYVADMNGRELLEIDPQSGAVRRVEVGAVPTGVAVTPDGATIVVAARDDDALVFVDAARFVPVARVAAGKHPFGVTIDADGRRVYAANVESDDVSIVDIADRKPAATVKVGKRPYGLALAQGRVFVANQYDETVSVFEARSLAPLATLKVGEYPESVAASADGRTVYVTNWFSNELWAIDVQSLKLVAKVATGDGPRAFGAFVRRSD